MRRSSRGKIMALSIQINSAGKEAEFERDYLHHAIRARSILTRHYSIEERAKPQAPRTLPQILEHVDLMAAKHLERNLKIARYAHRIGLEHEIVLAGLYRGVPDALHRAVKEYHAADRDAKNHAQAVEEALRTVQKENKQSADNTVEENLNSILHPNVHSIRASVIKSIDLALHLEDYMDLHPHGSNDIYELIRKGYLPLLRSCGLYDVHNMLGGKFVEVFHPRQYGRLKSFYEANEKYFKKAQSIAREKIAQKMDSIRRKGYDVSIIERDEIKPVYSLFTTGLAKQRSQMPTDVAGLRVVITPRKKEPESRTIEALRDAYKSIVNQRMKKRRTPIRIVPGREKDYVANPKENGYRSIHNTLAVPVTIKGTRMRIPVEVQFRTKEMDDEANDGTAAHFLYKTKGINPVQALSLKFNFLLARYPMAKALECVGKKNIVIKVKTGQDSTYEVVPRNASPLEAFMLHQHDEKGKLFPSTAKVTRQGQTFETINGKLEPSDEVEFETTKNFGTEQVLELFHLTHDKNVRRALEYFQPNASE